MDTLLQRHGRVDKSETTTTGSESSPETIPELQAGWMVRGAWGNMH